MEYEQEENQEGGLMDRLRESPRTVTALIIILIVAAAIYAFGGDDTPQDEAVISEEAATTEEAASDMEGEEAPGMANEEMADGEKTGSMAQDMDADDVVRETPTPVASEDLAAQRNALPEATETDEGYGEAAVAGDGLTHLARRAATRYLNDRTAGYAVTNEHRIYVEDYIKDRMERTPLSVGESRTISFGLLEEAFAAAGELNETQLQNLSQYTYVLS